jgi:hypothetical protein
MPTLHNTSMGMLERLKWDELNKVRRKEEKLLCNEQEEHLLKTKR